MLAEDNFHELARYYDPLMAHVNYDRWHMTATALAELCPDNFRHLDAACGTGVLLNMLQHTGWNSVGVDLSRAMLHTARRQRGLEAVAAADLRTLPFVESFDIITCLFDSVNFLLEEAHVVETMESFQRALRPGGVLYFDVVTERMVTQFFADQEWQEDNDGFVSRWSSMYDRKSKCAETRIRVNNGGESILREKIYTQKLLETLIADAGFELFAVCDAETWKAPRRKTTRMDFVAMKQPTPAAKRIFPIIRQNIQAML